MNKDTIQLNDGYTASRTFYARIYKMMMAGLPGKASGTEFIVKQLIDKKRWNELDSGERKLAGRCVAHMVANGRLPLDFAERNRANAQQYRLK